VSRRAKLADELCQALKILADPSVVTADFRIDGHRVHFDAYEKPLTIHSYLNTTSEAGFPSESIILPSDVAYAKYWTNSMGNPTYCLHMENGDTHLQVDEYGAMNGLPHISATNVRTRKEIF
tara:strand:- start:843 stop:1208 length:366 start_codon:yes stop_codon:yes gene_type:complete